MKNILIFLVILSLFLVSPAFGTNVMWDANPTADFYVVSWGEAPGNYTNNSESISKEVTAYEIDNPDDKNYFIVVEAFNDCGRSSQSTEIQHCRVVEVTLGVKSEDRLIINIDTK